MARTPIPRHSKTSEVAKKKARPRLKRARARSESGWQVELLRVTAFLSTDLSTKPLWQSAVGSEPSEVIQKPAEKLFQESGPFGENSRLIMTWRPPRIDWILSATQEHIVNNRLPFIGGYDDLINKFVSLTKKWLKDCPALSRLAIGAIVGYPVADPNRGYKKLDKLLPDVNVPAWGNASDFSYAINRKRNSKKVEIDPPLSLNRLTKWSCITTTGYGLFLDPSAGKFQQLETLPQLSFVRLELDVNTVPRSPDHHLQNETLIPVFDELCDLAKELMERGDMP